MKPGSIHPLQSSQWGEFRRETGVKVVRVDGWQLTIHRIPLTSFTMGYFPKGPLPTRKMIEQLIEIGGKENCIFIQLEPNIQKVKNLKLKIENLSLRPSARPLFPRYTFQLALTKTEEELLIAMHPKTRYNIRVAQRHGVKIVEDNSEKAFKIYLKLLKETTQRQRFYAHDERYHRLMWETLKTKGEGGLTAHLLIAYYSPKPSTLHPIPLVAWILFVYDGVLYYPYGASSDKYKNTMANNLMMWETIRFGKKMGCHTFDLWGSLGPNPDPKDPWYGFHRFKEGYGGKLVEFIGAYDLVLKPTLYKLYNLADNLRWKVLRLKRAIIPYVSS